MKGLYIHIPFCKHICKYCDFPKMVTFKEETMKKYIEKVKSEIETKRNQIEGANTIYIGGGTPNALPTYLLEELFKQIETLNLTPIEYSIEINPELLTNEQIQLFKKYNISRVSIGAESFDDNVLELLGRHHKMIDIENAINALREEGILNINCDLIFGHPFDSLKLINKNLIIAKELKVPHLSYYSMILEEHTIFNYQVEHHMIKEIDEDMQATMYDYIRKELKALGYHHYEISNYSYLNYESKHNLIYWSLDEYIGIGMGAASLYKNKRFTNSRSLKGYYDNLLEDVEEMDKKGLESDYMMLGLRRIDGISKKEFENRFNEKIKDVFHLEKLFDEGLIEENDEFIKLTEKGIDLANLVFVEFI